MMRKILLSLCVFMLLISGFTLAEEKVSNLALNYLKELFNENYFVVYEMQDFEMKSQFNVDKMKKLVTDIKAQLGKLKSMYYISQEERAGYIINVFRADYEKLSLLLTVVVDPKTNKITGFSFKPVQVVNYKPPKYANLDKITEKQIEFGEEPWKLKGSLTIPKDKKKYPLIILVHGSGPLDRDETIGPNRPFLDLALGLTSKGIAVLRYDKRTFTYRDKISVEDTTVKEEIVDDVLSAIKFVKTISEVSKIYVLGHSLGATLAPKIAEISKDVNGIILMAPMVQKLAATMLDQLNYVVTFTTLSEEQKKELENTKQLLEKLINHQLDPQRQVFGATARYFYHLDEYDVVAAISKLKIPVLILQGKKDYQTTVEKNFKILKEELSDKKNIRFKLYENLDHLFMYTEGISKPEDYEKFRNVDEEVIEDIAQWILAN